jgi:PAS domain S-box-containing protein
MERGSWSGEIRFRHFKTGKAIPVLYDAFRLDDPETGRPSNVGYVCRDITERKRAEETLRVSEERWRMLFEHSSVGMTMNDPNRRIVSANPAFQRIVGYTEEELRSLHPIKDLTHEEDREVSRIPFDEIYTGRRNAYHIEKRYVHKSGRTVWVDISASVVPATETAPMLYQAITVDITERKCAEAALRASEERWRRIFQTASVGIATSDADRRISRANQALQNMLGYTEAELQALRWPDLTHEDDQSLTNDWVANLEAGRRQAYQVEKRYRRKDGEFIWVNVNASHVPATDATPAFFASIIVDITDRKRAEDGLRHAQAELARVARVTTMGALGASIAHEINQPLAAIVASGNACKRWLENGRNLSRAKESLNRVISDAGRASEVVKRVRSLTKNKAPEQLQLNIDEVIDEVLALTRGELQAKGVLVRKELLPSPPTIKGDRVQLQQVLLNLIMNGIEAMAPVADRRRDLAIKSQLDDRRYLVVTVQDSGVGLDPSGADRIFEVFFTTKAEGMGMGLSMSASIVEAHGGRLWTSPGVPHGTAFHFTVPTAGANPS